MTIRTRFAALAVCCLAAVSAAPVAALGQDDEARAAAEAWLALIDGHDFVASWEAAASTMQQAVTADAWAAQLSAAHAQVGDVESRELAASQAMTDPPGAPAGEYVQIRFDTTFSTAGRVNEMVVVVRDGERGWRVAGYFLQPAG